MTMKFGAAFWIQRTDWPALRDACQAVDRVGWDSLWLDDHLLSDEGDWRDAKFEGWATLTALAALTEHVRLGLLVGANTFRNPGLTAKLATTLDHVSNGRAILGLGGAWFEREHDAFGIDFGSGMGERLDRLDESVGLIRRLLDGETVTHEGRFYRFNDALCRPVPVQARLPILIGGAGPKKTLRTTAVYADMWNTFGQPDTFAAQDTILRNHCHDLGRDESQIERSVTLDVVIRDTVEAARAVYDAFVPMHGLDDKSGSEYVSVWGPPTEVAARIRAYEAVGVDEVICIFRHPFDLETIERMREVRAALAG